MDCQKLFNCIFFPDYFEDLENDSIVDVEILFEFELEKLNSKNKIIFLEYCQLVLSEKSPMIWKGLIEEKVFASIINLRTSNSRHLKGGIFDYNLLGNSKKVFLLGIEKQIERIENSIPNLIKKEKIILKAFKSSDKSNRGQRYTITLDEEKINIKILFQLLVKEKYISDKTDFENFYMIFNHVNLASINPVSWIGKKYHFIALIYLLKEEYYVLRIEGWAFEKVLKHLFLDIEGHPFTVSSFGKVYRNIFNEIENPSSKSYKQKLDLIVKPSLIQLPPQKNSF